jgi:hypothetical protein
LTTPFDSSPANPSALQGLSRLIDTLDRYLRLPSTPQAFTLYLAGLALIFIGALLHVLVAAQIMAAQIQLGGLNSEYALIEQQNGELIFNIARFLSLERIQERAVGLGFGPATERKYVLVPEALPTEPGPNGTPPVAAAQTAPRPVTPTAPQGAAAVQAPHAPWAAWADFLGLPGLTSLGWTQAEAGGAPFGPEGASRPDLFTELSKQLERLGIR